MRNKGLVSFVLRYCVLATTMLMAPSQAVIAQDSYSELRKSIPAVDSHDINGVDVARGKLKVTLALISIGGMQSRLSPVLSMETPTREFEGPSADDNRSTDLKTAVGRFVYNSISTTYQISTFGTPEFGTLKSVSMPGEQGLFNIPHPSHTITNSDGSTIQPNYGPGFATYMTFPSGVGNGIYNAAGIRMTTSTENVSRVGITTVEELPDQIIFPNGETWKFYYERRNYTYNSKASVARRLRYIVASTGNVLQYSYTVATSGSGLPAYDWWAPSSLVVYNKAKVYCDESLLAQCVNPVSTSNKTEFQFDNSSGIMTVLNAGQNSGMKINFMKDSSNRFFSTVSSYEEIGSAASKVVLTHAMASDGYSYSEPYVSRINRDGQSWNYAFDMEPLDGRIIATSSGQVTDPAGGVIRASSYPAFGLVFHMSDQLGRTSGVVAGDQNDRHRVRGVTLPSGSFEYTLDSRNNILSILRKSKNGSSSYIVSSASFPGECFNPKTCNLPNSLTDANGNVVNFVYDDVHGGLLTEVGPAVGGVNPAKKYAYAQRYAWLKNAGGTYSQAATPVWLRTEERSCKSSNLDLAAGTCGGGATDLIVTSYDYGPNSSSVGNNLLLRGVAVTAADGDGTVKTFRTCYGYDDQGNKIWETAPKAGLAACY